MSEETIIIRPECLRPYTQNWEQPTGNEIREVIRLTRFSGSEVAKALGLGGDGSRTVRRWAGGSLPIPYTAWAILCDYAGLGIIWRSL